jgi:hypothetical protein
MSDTPCIFPPGFSITGHKGFRIRFENGWAVSVQFGPGNYCEHYHSPLDFEAPRREDHWKSDTAEVAVIHERADAWADPYTLEIVPRGREVEGRCTPERVLYLLNAAAALPANPVLPPDTDTDTLTSTKE